MLASKKAASRDSTYSPTDSRLVPRNLGQSITGTDLCCLDGDGGGGGGGDAGDCVGDGDGDGESEGEGGGGLGGVCGGEGDGGLGTAVS